MRGLALGSYKRVVFATAFVFGSMAIQLVSAQGNRNTGYRLSVVGIAVKDYKESQDFYEKKMGLREAFKFSSQDGQRTTTYYQLSRDTFLEMQSATADVPPGFTHVHMAVDDLNATIARLKQDGVPGSARNTTTPGTVTEAGIAQPSNVKNANIFEPNGLRLELNELIPESLTRKATESWADTYPSYRLGVIGIAARNIVESQNFYEKKMGLRAAFTINNDAQHPYYQLSRETFMELGAATATAPPGFTHVHLIVDDLTKTLARLKQNGVTQVTRDVKVPGPGTVTEPNFATPSQIYAAVLIDPSGIRLELNQLVESLPKKATESWK